MTIIRTERCVLRSHTLDDAEAIAPLLGDYAVSRWLARVPFPYALENARRFVIAATADEANGMGLVLALEVDGRFAGGVGFHDLQPEARLGYWIRRDLWGRGLMSEAARAMLDHGFGSLGLTRVLSGVFAGNDASLRIQEKLGFRVTGEHPVYSDSRRAEIRHIDTELDRAAFEAAIANRPDRETTT